MNCFLAKLFLIVTFSGLIGTLHGEHCLLDLGEVLVHTHKVAAFRNIGLKPLVKYVIEQRRISGVGQHLRDRLFDFLEHIQERDPSCPAAYDEEGRLLPQSMCNWLTGATKPEDLLHLIEKKAKSDPSFFNGPAEKEVLLAIAHMMFSPERFIKTRAVNRAGLAFVQACKDAGHSTYILSNWEEESFELLKKMYPEFETLFDGSVISGEAGYIKPDKEIYTKLLEKYNLDPAECIFLDDRQENLDRAKELGIATILCSREKVQTFDPIYDELNSWLESRRTNLAPQTI